MLMHERIAKALKHAMKDNEQDRLSTLRLINAAIKDREIALRSGGEGDASVDDAEVLAIMGKMIRQRQESTRAYEESGRLELAEKELGKVKVIEELLPRQLKEDEVTDAIDAAIGKVGAGSIRDMGRVMGELKSKYAGQMDFGRAGAMVKDRLAS